MPPWRSRLTRPGRHCRRPSQAEPRRVRSWDGAESASPRRAETGQRGGQGDGQGDGRGDGQGDGQSGGQGDSQGDGEVVVSLMVRVVVRGLG